MTQTPISLLERLRLRPDPASWQRLIDLYAPLVRVWLRRYALQPADADDLTQEVLAVLVRELPQFRHDLRRGAFRRWLRTVLVNRLRAFWRGRRRQAAAGEGRGEGGDVLGGLEDPGGGLSRLWDREHDEHVARRLMELLEPEFEPTTWQAFRLLTLEGKGTAEVAAELGISQGAARVAKSRVLRRFRQEIDGLVD
jgi:RNA polymerase sigma factor (sigma-70 family)